MELRFRKKILFFALWGVFFVAGIDLVAQDAANQNVASDENVTLVRTYNIRKIYSHRLGYRIDVQNYLGQIRTIYAKISWFADPEQRDPNSENYEVAANMGFLPTNFSMPSNYMTLKYVGGKLMTMMIYMDEPSPNKNSIWAAIPPGENIDDKFNIKKVTFSDPPPVPAGPMPKAAQEQVDTAAVQN